MQLIEHLQKGAERLYPPMDGQLDQRHGDYLESFQSERLAVPRQVRFPVPVSDRSLILSAADYLLRAEHFQTGAGPDFDRGTLDASFEQSFTGEEGWLAWVRRATRELRLSIAIHLEVGADGLVTLFTSRPLPTWLEEFQYKLDSVLKKTPDDLVKLFGGSVPGLGDGDAIPHDLLLGPGERLEGPFTGMLWDYSGCASVAAEYSYRMLTRSITNALRPFSRHGTLYRRTSKGRVDQAPDPTSASCRSIATMRRAWSSSVPRTRAR
jgi:hypothetical protein